MNFNNIQHIRCMLHGIAVSLSEKATLASQNVDLGMVLDLTDDFALVLVAMFT